MSDASAVFDVAVIGLGMIGSAALRYLSAPDTGLRAVGVGPLEPVDWPAHGGAFASHYDQARITRIADPDPIWAALAQRAMGHYADIAERSGAVFHHPVGLLRIASADPEAIASLGEAERVGRALHAPLTRLTQQALTDRFPLVKTTPGAEALHETGAAGYIVPRALVAAQTRIAADQGAQLVRDEVAHVARDSRRGLFVLTTRTGVRIEARRVLFSAHGYTNGVLHTLLGRALDLVSLPHTTVYAELDDAQARRFADVPVLIWQLAGHPVLPSIYTTPPSVFPDGRRYLKIGGPLHTYQPLRTPAEMLTWFHSAGNPVEIEALQDVLLGLLDGLRVRRWASKPCMNTYTPHDHPFIDTLDDGVYVCTGGCGGAAKSSDEIGRMGAQLVLHDAWTSDLPADQFRAVYAAGPA